VEFDWLTFGLEVVNFLVLVWLLKRFLYRPVLAAIARRKAAIERTLADADGKEARAAQLEAQYRDRLEAWEAEKRALRAQADRDLEAERARRMAELDQALAAERERRRVLEQRSQDELRERTEDASLAQGAAFAARLLERLATPELEARLVALALEDLAALAPAQRQALRDALGAAAARLEVTSAFALSEPARSALLHGFGEALGAPVTADFSEDPRLVAGLRARVGPWVMHANLRDELAFFAEASGHGA
jgi:F-type H+-transporting ATPase subunit b